MQRACTGTGISDSLLMLGAVNLLIEGNLTAGRFFRKPIAVSPTHVSRMVPRAQEATDLLPADGSSAGGNEILTLVQRDARANPGSVEKASRRTGVDEKSCLCSRGAEVGSIVTEGEFHPFNPSTTRVTSSHIPWHCDKLDDEVNSEGGQYLGRGADMGRRVRHTITNAPRPAGERWDPTATARGRTVVESSGAFSVADPAEVSQSE